MGQEEHSGVLGARGEKCTMESREEESEVKEETQQHWRVVGSSRRTVEAQESKGEK